MSLKCLDCGKVIEELEGRIRCPYCGYRIFMKMKPRTVKRVKA